MKRATISAFMCRFPRLPLDGGQGTTNDVLDAEAAVIRAAVTVRIARWRQGTCHE